MIDVYYCRQCGHGFREDDLTCDSSRLDCPVCGSALTRGRRCDCGEIIPYYKHECECCSSFWSGLIGSGVVLVKDRFNLENYGQARSMLADRLADWINELD